MTDTEVPVPPQYQPQPLVDFRHQEAGPRGFKVRHMLEFTVAQPWHLADFGMVERMHLLTLTTEEHMPPEHLPS